MKQSLPLLLIVIFAIAGCNSNPSPKKGAYTDFKRGYDLWYYYQLDSAFNVFNQFVKNAENTLEKGSAYQYMGDIQWSLGDVYGAEESISNALHILDTGNKTHYLQIAYCYNNLGNINVDIKHYDDAIKYYNHALLFLKDSAWALEPLNGKATALQKKGNYEAALAVYDSIITLNPPDSFLAARAIDNRARTKWLLDPSADVLPQFQAALQIRINNNQTAGQYASYSHLSDYYTKINPDSALWYAAKMKDKANENQNPNDELDAIDKLLRLNPSATVKEQLFEKYTQLRDSLQLSRDTTRSRFAMIKYDYKKIEAEKLILKQDMTKQQFWTYGSLTLAAVIIAFLSLWYNKRRKRIKQESELAIRNSKLKTSQKVHDVVANGLYGIMNELEHKKTVDKEPLINKIEDLYKKSRNISQEDPLAENIPNYDQQVHELLTAFSNEETSVFVVGNQPAFWNGISQSQKQQLRLVLTELMVNMKKHSGAKNVVVQFKKEVGLAYIHYKDDGVGFPNDVNGSGKGLENTVSRINSLNGKITFGKNDKGGASVAIDFPTQS